MDAGAEEPDVQVLAVLPSIAPDIWDKIEFLVRRSLDEGSHGEFSPDDIRRQVESGRDQLWVVTIDSKMVGIMIAEAIAYPQYKAASLYLIAGTRIKEWATQGGAAAVAWAMAQGCKAIEGNGRHGWRPIAKQLGFLPTFQRYRKEL